MNSFIHFFIVDCRAFYSADITPFYSIRWKAAVAATNK